MSRSRTPESAEFQLAKETGPRVTCIFSLSKPQLSLRLARATQLDATINNLDNTAPLHMHVD